GESQLEPQSSLMVYFLCYGSQVAGGAAGQDGIYVVCSGENTWLFCATYDGFNRIDDAYSLACTFMSPLCSISSYLI
ncbi:unnamed protein product, partial [Brassica rapa]